MIIFENDYSWEMLYDYERDLNEAINPDYNEKAPKEGEFKGIIRVTIEYIKEENKE